MAKQQKVDAPEDAAEVQESTLVGADLAAESDASDEAKQSESQEGADASALPESMAIANPAPATEVDSGSGAIVEQEIKDAIPLDHPSVDNNPRAGTTAVQNGGDFNDPRHQHPSDPDFAGQGLDLSVYGKDEAAK